MVMVFVKNSIRFIVLLFFYVLSLFRKKDSVTFIPHLNMCKNDNYSIVNYKSDCALSFLNFILENNYLIDRTINVAISKNNDLHLISDYVKERYNSYKIRFYKSLDPVEFNANSIKEFVRFLNALSKSSHVFTSQTYRLPPLLHSRRIIKVNLGYYSASFKSDIMDINSPYYIGYKKVTAKDFDYYICSSNFSILSIYPTFSIPYCNYLNLGMCRNDYLFSNSEENTIRKILTEKVSYPVSKIILYTPTHKDYERDLGLSAARELLGFNAELLKMDLFLKSRGMMIICKLHPHQNKYIIKKDLPESIRIFEPNSNYGLAELMKASDCLITDYTSGYFDYLIMDKPVIFNFYDVEVYNAARGFTFMPIETICAGDIIKTESELLDALTNIEQNRVNYREKRKLIKDLVFSNQDADTCGRVYRFFFN